MPQTPGKTPLKSWTFSARGGKGSEDRRTIEMPISNVSLPRGEHEFFYTRPCAQGLMKIRSCTRCVFPLISLHTFPPLRRTSDFLGGAGSLAKKSGLPVFWQFAHDVRRFLLSSHKEATTTMVVEALSSKKPIRRSARPAGLGALAAMGRRVGARIIPLASSTRSSTDWIEPVCTQVTWVSGPSPTTRTSCSRSSCTRRSKAASRPANGHAMFRDSDALRWLGQGIQPSRSALYDFRDRLSEPVFEMHARTIQQAIDEGLTAAEAAVLDGTSARSGASRHQLVNGDKLTKRLQRAGSRRGPGCDRSSDRTRSRTGWPRLPAVDRPNSSDTDGPAMNSPTGWPLTKNAPRTNNCLQRRSKSVSPTRRHPWAVTKRKSFVRCTHRNSWSIPRRC